MKQRLLDLLCCPACQSPFDQVGNRLVCSCQSCRSKYQYSIENGIPRFADDHGLESFSEEWTRFRRTQLDSVSKTRESLETFKAKTGFSLPDMTGKLVLDAGCGAGRFMEIALNQGAEVVGIDASRAIDAACANLGHRPGAHFAQADIRRLSFRNETFDYILSIGVLHHTPNTEEAFMRLPRLLKPGGEIAIWVYSADSFPFRMYNTVSGMYRIVTTRLPHEMVLRWAQFLARATYPARRVPLLKSVATLLVPSSGHPNFEWRVLDNFDWYSAKWQWKHTYREVEAWFEEAGLEHKRLGVPVTVWGKKRD